MTNTFRIKNRLVLSAVAALLMSVTAAAYADDAVKAGGATDRPGRQIEQDNAVKSRGATDVPGRAVEEDTGTVKSGDNLDKPGRKLNDDKAKKKAKRKPVQQ